jgi:hypothetical protein
MMMPGFTAEVSLHRTSGRYHTMRTGGTWGPGDITPAQDCDETCLRPCQEDCKANSYGGSQLGACLLGCRKECCVVPIPPPTPHCTCTTTKCCTGKPCTTLGTWTC